jgi:hypothetical protein
VRFGRVRLFFSHFELIAFQLDDWALVVVVPEPSTASHVEADRKHLEPDKKCLTTEQFEAKWQEVAEEVLGSALSQDVPPSAS